MAYEDLDLRLFVSGELNIIDRQGISHTERTGRMRLLKDILFLAGLYEWKGLLDLYAAIINQIERGLKSWESDFSSETSLVLLPHAKQGVGNRNQETYSSRGRSSTRVRRGMGARPVFSGNINADVLWYCQQYQRNDCSRTDPHPAWINGRPVTVHHICARCYLADRKRAGHPESAENCPHNN